MKRTLLSLLVPLVLPLVASAVSARELGLAGDGKTDDTSTLSEAFRNGVREIEFEKGDYVLGTVSIPGNTVLRFSPDARVLIAANGITEVGGEAFPLFHIDGDTVRMEGLTVDNVAKPRRRTATGSIAIALTSVVYSKGHRDLRLVGLRIRNADEKAKFLPEAVHLDQCSDIEGRDGEFLGLSFCYMLVGCRNASIHGNRAENCSTITSFTRGSEGLRHFDNWSRNVVYQCVFRGGPPDPSRKAPAVPLGSSKVAIRGLDIGNPSLEYYRAELEKVGASGVVLDGAATNSGQWHMALSGTYDIQIIDNYAEYGRTLAWGNRGREVVFAGNVSRFMTDYAYGVEGCENVVFANNISINARSVGIMSMYWGEKLVLCGNMVIVRDEPYRQDYSWMPDQSGYWGGFFRFHHGPNSAEDAAAGSEYGGGSAIVSGNLFINELTDRVRGVLLESGRDVTISGNKFVNGCIRKGGAGMVSILSNEFVSRMPIEHMVVSPGGSEMVIAGNVMRYLGGGPRRQLREIAADGTDEAENAQADDRLLEKFAAIQMAAPRRGGVLRRLVVKGNVVTGWTEAAIHLECPPMARGLTAPDILIRDNDIEGAIRVLGEPGDYRLLEFGNTDLTAFKRNQ